MPAQNRRGTTCWYEHAGPGPPVAPCSPQVPSVLQISLLLHTVGSLMQQRSLTLRHLSPHFCRKESKAGGQPSAKGQCGGGAMQLVSARHDAVRLGCYAQLCSDSMRSHDHSLHNASGGKQVLPHLKPVLLTPASRQHSYGPTHALPHVCGAGIPLLRQHCVSASRHRLPHLTPPFKSLVQHCAGLSGLMQSLPHLTLRGGHAKGPARGKGGARHASIQGRHGCCSNACCQLAHDAPCLLQTELRHTWSLSHTDGSPAQHC